MAVPSAMMAVVMDDYGAPNVLRLASRPMPQRMPGQALIRVIAAGVNPADVKWRAGQFASFAPVIFPYVPGYDIAGVIVESDRRAAGIGVMGKLEGLQAGAYAEYAACDEDALSVIPDMMSYVQAAALPTAALTGVQLIETHIRPNGGDRILITGATGAVGRFAVYSAKAAGAHVTAVVRDSKRADALAAGADVALCIDEDAGKIAPFDHLADTVGGAAVTAWCRRVKRDGRVRTVATAPIPCQGLDIEAEFIAVRSDGLELARIAQAVSTGVVEMPVSHVLPLSSAEAAHRLLERGGLSGKIVLAVDASAVETVLGPVVGKR